ncbi:azurin [Haloferula chungangensis]|uniref:Azurin n=1 Tax=Haloferula chungangensis TaxID=1048331 RepID=A0ABW2L7B3_9BACT
MKTLLISLFTLAATVLGATAQDAVKLEITGNDQMQYDKKELTVTEGQKVTLTLKHVGKLPKAAMGHNVVILKAGTEIPPFAMKAAPAAASDYIPQDEESKKLIVAHTKMVGGGETTSVSFTAPAAGEYPYICTFPGHFGLMTGKLIVKAK